MGKYETQDTGDLGDDQCNTAQFSAGMCFCILFRPLIDGIRYSGINNNPIPFALYLNMVIISFCASLLKRQK